jgi:glycosyltransferase involved in cell wall biosynthesis
VPGLQALSPRLKVVMVGGDGVSYGARLGTMGWREYMLGQVGDRIDPARLAFPGKIPYESFLQLLQRSDAHVYLTYPFVLSWSLREAMACGCAIVGSRVAPVEEFVADGRTGLLIDFPDEAAIVAAVERLMQRPALAKRLRREARAEAERTLRMDRYIEGYERLIRDVIARGPQER